MIAFVGKDWTGQRWGGRLWGRQDIHHSPGTIYQELHLEWLSNSGCFVQLFSHVHAHTCTYVFAYTNTHTPSVFHINRVGDVCSAPLPACDSRCNIWFWEHSNITVPAEICGQLSVPAKQTCSLSWWDAISHLHHPSCSTASFRLGS